MRVTIPTALALLILVGPAIPTAPAHAQGTVQTTSFYSAALDREQDLRVYLPEGYDPDRPEAYPVVTFLHGAGGSALDPNYDFVFVVLDDLIDPDQPDAGLQPVVVLMPDGAAEPYAGSMWANSELYGAFEDQVVTDLTAFAELTYHVRTDRDGRAIMGYSMGGIGAMSIAAAHPGIYCAVASCSGAPDFSGFPTAFFPVVLQEHGAPPYAFVPTAGIFSTLTFTAAGAYSPNLENPPYLVDIPLDADGELRPDVFARWLEHDAATRIQDVTPGDLGIYFICGTNDELNLLPMNESFATVLDDLGHPYVFETDDGFHFSPAHVGPRVQSALLFLDGCLGGVVPVAAPDPPDATPAVPARPELRAAPNPFNPGLTVSFALAHPQTGRLTVHDLAGRVVRVLRDGWFAAGEQGLRWDGRDAAGRTAPSGTYLIRLDGEEVMAVRKVQLVR
jgi:S-formylglutathione hydrolase FrmB